MTVKTRFPLSMTLWVLTLFSAFVPGFSGAMVFKKPNVVYILSDDVGWGDLSCHGGHGANAHGFDEAWIYYGGGADYFNRRTVKGRGPVSWWHNREFRGNDEGYTDDLVTHRAIEFIRENKEHAFFCYIPHHIAHAPLHAKEVDLKATSSIDASG